MNAISPPARSVILSAITLFIIHSLAAQSLDDHKPIGVTGAFEGVITTGCAYNVLNHNATRQIDDIVVPASIGKYPLKMTRYYNSRSTGIYGSMGAGWTHEYQWGWDPTGPGGTTYPNGNRLDGGCEPPVGVSDGWESQSCCPYRGDFRLADGGKVHFDTTNGYTHATTITDPYGQVTSLTYNPSGLLTRVTEPGGRYLQFNYSIVNGVTLLTEVDANDGQGNQIDSVIYHYASKPTGGAIVTTGMCLTSVDYSDSQHASYTYTTDNAPESTSTPCPCNVRTLPLIYGCDDVRYHGAMRRIAYEYQAGGPHGAILKEHYWDGVAGHEGNGVVVSGIVPALASPLVTDNNYPTTFTESRGDGPTRTFNYTAMHLHLFPEDTCPTSTQSPNLYQQFIQSYTDYTAVPRRTTYFGYDTNWYVNSVTDARGSGLGDPNYTTAYVRGSPPPIGIGEIKKITHPDGSHIDYTYQSESGAIGGHYVATLSNERQKVTTYTRDPNTPPPTAHLVTRIDYPSDANTPASYETFTYNSFGQILTHRFRNDAWESFVYGGRGLLIDKYNPKQGSVPSGVDPHIHYTYYTTGPWTDRVQTMSPPANWLGHVASETYEYDRALDGSGITNLTGAAVAGRGLITKITHADNTYQQFKYDAFGNKRWEDNELREPNTYTYDDYNRLLTAMNPLSNTTRYTYIPTNGGGGSSYKHTTNSPDTTTTPAGIVTRNVYDENFRKTSTTAADGTPMAATTWLHYDAVGNQDYVTDPRGTNTPGTYTTYTDYDSRNRKWQVREPLGHTTQFYYDDNINITRIIRPDTTTETKTYDAMNRVLTDTVPKTASPVVNIVTQFHYNPSGTIDWVKDAENRTTYFSYDASDRKIAMTYPAINGQSDTLQWGYDDAGNMNLRTTAGVNQQAFFYDERNFLYAKWWNTDWDNGIVDWIYFDHDATGRLTEAENGTNGWGANIISDVHRFYNAAGQLTQEQQVITGLGTKNVWYPLHDGDGKLTRMYVGGVTGYDFSYSYDAMGRFEKISLTGGAQLFQYYYDAASNETERDNLSNGVNQLYPRDALNRMQYVDVKKGATTLSHEWYTYDPMNRISGVTYGTGSPDSFGYYLDGELNTATLGNLGHTLAYNLDKKGNRTTVVDNNVTTTYSRNTIDQYVSVTGSSIANGSEHEISDFQGVHYTYINDERLKSAAAGTTTYTMTYDALGRCMKRVLSNGPTTYYVYDGDKPILEYDGSGTSVGTNVYGKGVDEILERVAVGVTYFPQQNHEGSVNLLTDTSGNAIERYRYDAFGAPTIYTGGWGARSATIYDNRFLFTGREYAATYRATTTAAFNFYEYRARAYNPTLGRFMSEDPKLFDAGDYNLFRYCHNDPVDRTDPMGLIDIMHLDFVKNMSETQKVQATQQLTKIFKNIERKALERRAQRDANKMTQGIQERSPSISKTEAKQPGAGGLINVDRAQIEATILSGMISKRLSGPGSEANVAATYDEATKQFGHSQSYVFSDPLQGLGKQAYVVKLGAGDYKVYAGQGHYHEGGEPLSPHDFRFSNTTLLPVNIGFHGANQLYIPLMNAPANFPSNAGVIISY